MTAGAGAGKSARTIDAVERWLAPHAKSVSVLAAIWFWIGVAIQARFMSVPDLPPRVEQAIFWAGVAFNVIWWGFLRRAIEQRRRSRGDGAR